MKIRWLYVALCQNCISEQDKIFLVISSLYGPLAPKMDVLEPPLMWIHINKYTNKTHMQVTVVSPLCQMQFLVARCHANADTSVGISCHWVSVCHKSVLHLYYLYLPDPFHCAEDKRVKARKENRNGWRCGKRKRWGRDMGVEGIRSTEEQTERGKKQKWKAGKWEGNRDMGQKRKRD